MHSSGETCGKIRAKIRAIVGRPEIIQACYQDEQYSVEVQVPSLFQDDTVSWVRIVNGVGRYVTESMPTAKEEDKASVKPAAKARPILRPSSTSGWDSTPMEQRKWIDIEIEESEDPYFFQVSKFITRLLRHSQQINREEDAGVHYDKVIEECKKSH